MGDLVKIGAKVALIALITAGVIGLFANIQLPAFDLSVIQNTLGNGLALAEHWILGFDILWGMFKIYITFDLALLAFKGVSIAWRWIMKVNE